MGLHPDMKKYIAERFPGCVSESPKEKCQVLVCDYMWLLFKFFPDEFSRGDDLIDFIWGPIAQFFDAGGETYVMCFDRPERVPKAKAEEHAKRYGKVEKGAATVMTCVDCDAENLPLPWHAALADRRIRKNICKFISESVLDRFLELGYGNDGKATLFSHGTDGVVKSARSNEKRDCPEHASAAEIGEGDLSVAYWIGRYPNKVSVARVLDSDQIPILMLCCLMKKRSASCFVWLVSPTRSEKVPEEYIFLPAEKRVTLDVGKLNTTLRNDRINAFEFVFMMICQKTDFVDKIIKNVGVAASMRLSETRFRGIVNIKGSAASCDPAAMERCVRDIAAHSGKKRAQVTDSIDVELRRAWWNLLYWTFGTNGALPERLHPSRAFGFEATGMRPVEKKIDAAFPFF